MPPNSAHILHLSDLHITSTENARLWYGQLAADLKGELDCDRLDALVISGDVGNHSVPGEYAAAEAFLEPLCREFGLSPDRLVIVPGNHDLNWDLARKGYTLADRADVEDQLHEGSFIPVSDEVVRLRNETTYPQRFINFSEFHRNVTGRAYPPESDAQWILRHLSDLGILILGFNSSWQIDHYFTARAAIDNGALHNALEAIRKDPALSDCLKIAVWHHPLTGQGPDRITDHGFMQRLAAAGFCLALHGHIHKADAGLYRYDMSPDGRKLNIVGAGTFGAPVRDWTPGYPLQYNLIRLSGRQATVETRRRIEPGGAWEPDAMWRQGKGKDPLPRYALDFPCFVKSSSVSACGKTTEAISETSPSDSAFEKEIANYCTKAAALHERIQLAGFRTRLRVPLKIDDVFVPLRVVPDLSAHGKGRFADAEDAEAGLAECGENNECSVPDAFTLSEKLRRRGIVILGDPGSGKTTHLKRLLLWCMDPSQNKVSLPAEMLPVYLPLRDLKNLDKGLDAFIQAQLSDPLLETAPGFGRRMVDRGRLLFLFDGLDEVADAKMRAKVSRFIDRALAVNPTCRFVVTCRYAGYDEASRLGADFLEMHMRPLSDEQAAAFVHNWYRAVETGRLVDRTQAVRLAARKAEDLLNRLKAPEFRASRVYGMTRNPLLLTNLCLVHNDGGRLPSSRARLYEECIEVLLERWHGAVGVASKITAATGKRVLQPAALWLHQEENRTRAAAAELAPQMAGAIRAAGWSFGSAAEFLKAVRDESGLLTGWDQDRYGFMHLGFQEYLAAMEIRRRAFEEDPAILQELASQFGQSWWQEVILLLLAMDNPSVFKPFMESVVSRQAFADHPELIELCLAEATASSAEPFVELLQAAPGRDKRFWRRQLAAVMALKHLDPQRLETLSDTLRRHPSPAIHKRFRAAAAVMALDAWQHPESGYEMVRIPGGQYRMGSPPDEKERYPDEGPLHRVTVPEFYLGIHPVTNEQYGRYLKANPKAPVPSYWTESRFNQPRQPVVGVSWEDARRFAAWAGLRLPSEAEWEYACRAGSQTRFYTGNTEEDLDKAGWYGDNSQGRLHPVGEKEPNAFGLYDMHGNVFEWMEDHWHNDYKGAPSDGRAWVDTDKGQSRVGRGGGWFGDARSCRSAFRDDLPPGYRYDSLGFRLALSPGR